MRTFGFAAGMCLAASALSTSPAAANMCPVQGPGYQLASDTIEWSMRVRAGQTCIRGVRGAAVVLKGLEVVEPPRSGEVSVQGPAFTFKANPDASGEDSFSLRLSGSMNRLEGSSTIVVRVRYDLAD